METEPLVDAKTLSELYGPTRAWWYVQAVAKRVPSYKIGRKCLRFRLSEVEAWLATQRRA